MNYRDPDQLAQNISFLHNAELFMRTKNLSDEAIKAIVVDPSNIIARSKDTGVVVSEGVIVEDGDAQGRTVRVVVSEKGILGDQRPIPK